MKAIIIFLGNLIFINQNKIGLADDNLSSFDGDQSISARSESTDQMTEDSENKFSSRSSEDLRSLSDDEDESSIENDEDEDGEESDESRSRIPKLKLPKAVRKERQRLLKKVKKKVRKIRTRLRLSGRNDTDYDSIRNMTKIDYESIIKNISRSSNFIKGKGWIDNPQAVKRFVEGSSWEKHAKQKNISKRAKNSRHGLRHQDMKRTGIRKHKVQSQRAGRFRNLRGGRQRGSRLASTRNNDQRNRYKSLGDKENKRDDRSYRETE